MQAAPALAFALVGAGLVYAASKKKKPPAGGGGASGSARDRGLDAIEDAIAACPEHEGEILAAGEAFAVELEENPTAALAQLERSLDVYCPTGAPDDGEPSPGQGDVFQSPGELAQEIKEQAGRVGCENLPPDLVRAFQRAATADGVPRLDESGEYDFATAIAANMYVQGAPPPCRQPPAPEVPEDVEAEGEKWGEILDELSEKSPGWT